MSPRRTPAPARARPALTLLAIPLWAGCQTYGPLRVAGAVTSIVEPERQAAFLRYVPTHYDRKKKWALVVACHGNRPWDSPRNQMRRWAPLAEDKGFLVVIPTLTASRSFPRPQVDDQLQRQIEDEQRMLAIVRHVRAGHSVSADRIFLAGSGAGAYGALYTGLRHPELFRAVAVLMGEFDSAFLAGVVERLDPYQPVLALYRSTDLLSDGKGAACVEWLHAHLIDVVVDESGRAAREPAKRAHRFFVDVLQRMPRLQLRAFSVAEDGMTVKFSTRASFEPQTFAWSFGDGGTSSAAEPTHTFTAPGSYRVTLRASMPKKRRPLERNIEIEVPYTGAP